MYPSNHTLVGRRGRHEGFVYIASDSKKQGQGGRGSDSRPDMDFHPGFRQFQLSTPSHKAGKASRNCSSAAAVGTLDAKRQRQNVRMTIDSI